MDTEVRQNALRMLSSGVYVLSSGCEDRYGAATVTWVSQVSFKPPLIMAAVRRQSNVFTCMADSRVAALHIVGDDQQEIAQRFLSTANASAGTIRGEPVADVRTATQILANLPARIECQVERIVETEGDHALVILQVVQAACREQIRPLTTAETPWEYGA